MKSTGISRELRSQIGRVRNAFGDGCEQALVNVSDASCVTTITVTEAEGMEHPPEFRRLSTFAAGTAVMPGEAVLFISNGRAAEEGLHIS
ncbi:hypothetical protein [Methylobacterium sp. ARG-1]|uniref:hypothetical protein n=1 Tax=Methylobacterium sp. ARG-1 TaxID=1692501 RepID=UPI001364CE51|nr:hypothetical protein [Methylobacterium sp. ARG-1]